MLVAIYVRVSTLDQAEGGYSLDMQERVLRDWCEANGHSVFRIYADRGISGKDIQHRSGMTELLSDASCGKFEAILFWALSRFTRSVSDLYITMDALQKKGVSIISYTEAFDTSSPMGRAMIGMVGVFAQLEREITGERVSAVMHERAIQGKRTCHEVLWYDIVGRDSFCINPKEAEYVLFCFKSYLKYQNLSYVAKIADRHGYLGKRGRRPSPYAVEKIITRPIYCGYNVFKGVPYKGDYESIVDVDTYNKVQETLMLQGYRGRNRKEQLIFINQGGGTNERAH